MYTSLAVFTGRAAPSMQLDLPFVEAHRCREVQFALRMGTTWKHTDHGFSEIDYELSKATAEKDPDARKQR